MEEYLVRYFHFLGIITMVSALIGEYLLISKEMDVKSFKRLVILDGVYGVAAILTLINGMLLWISVGKPAEFYSSNFIFHIKLSLFLCVFLLSIPPTVYFLRNFRKKFQSITVPSYIIMLIHVELLLLFTIPLLATMMARGLGNE